jgi:hypothetical protein
MGRCCALARAQQIGRGAAVTPMRRRRLAEAWPAKTAPLTAANGAGLRAASAALVDYTGSCFS